MIKHNFRIWDPNNQFPEGHIKRFKYWSFEVSYRQHTLGSFLILLNRKAQKISDLTSTELISLGKVMKFAEKILTKTFKPDHFNYLQLGNSTHHLHFHGIPRYQTKRFFNKKNWIDKNFNLPPVWSYKNVPHALVKKIKLILIKNLSNS